MAVSSAHHASAALLPWEKATLPVEQEAGYAPDPIWTIFKTEKPLAPAGIRTPDCPAVA
jgi:hypothetical protein